MDKKTDTAQLQKRQESNLKHTTTSPEDAEKSAAVPPAKEIGGRTQGLDPTRYGDWEFKGRCIDF